MRLEHQKSAPRSVAGSYVEAWASLPRLPASRRRSSSSSFWSECRRSGPATFHFDLCTDRPYTWALLLLKRHHQHLCRFQRSQLQAQLGSRHGPSQRRRAAPALPRSVPGWVLTQPFLDPFTMLRCRAAQAASGSPILYGNPEGGDGPRKEPRSPRAAEAHLGGGLAQGLPLVKANLDEPTLALGQMTELGSDEYLKAVVLGKRELGHSTAIPPRVPRLFGPLVEFNELDVAGRRVRLKAFVRTPAEPVLGANSVHGRARDSMTSEDDERDPSRAVKAVRCLDETLRTVADEVLQLDAPA